MINQVFLTLIQNSKYKAIATNALDIVNEIHDDV